MITFVSISMNYFKIAHWLRGQTTILNTSASMLFIIFFSSCLIRNGLKNIKKTTEEIVEEIYRMPILQKPRKEFPLLQVQHFSSHILLLTLWRHRHWFCDAIVIDFVTSSSLILWRHRHWFCDAIVTDFVKSSENFWLERHSIPCVLKPG